MAPSSVDLTATTPSMASSHVFSERMAPPRAPSSVTSHSTSKHTRRHRSSRSHHGGGSTGGGSGGQSQNEFPNFAHTGDVEIVVAYDGQERRYLLHRLILARCSGFFEASTSEQWSGVDGGGMGSDETGGSEQEEDEKDRWLRPQQQYHDALMAKPVNGYNSQALAVVGEVDGSGANNSNSNNMQVATVKKPFWRYELDCGTGSEDIPMLVRQNNSRRSLFGGSSPQPRPPPARSKPPASSAGFFRSISAMQSVVHAPGILGGGSGGEGGYGAREPPNELIRDYDNLFRIFYNYPPRLDSVTITEAYIQSKTLLALADMYDALEVVGPRIDHHLLQFQGRLWKQIAKYPPSYLKLGYLARSKTIFGEAMTHVVGQWPAGRAQLRAMPRPVLDLIEDKADDLDELRARLEGQLFRLTVVNSKGERAAPHNPNSLDWLAVSLFRHWLSENLPPPPSPIVAGFGTTVNPNPTGHKSVSFSPHTTANGRPDPSSHAPIPVLSESVLSASAQNNTSSSSASGGMAASGEGGAPQPSRSSLVPATGRAFRLLGQAGQAYLPHDELKKHLKTHLDPSLYDKTQLRRFEKRIDDLKIQAQAVVRPLTRNALQMDIVGGSGGGGGTRDGGSGSTGGLSYLTCAGVGEGEWPW